MDSIRLRWLLACGLVGCFAPDGRGGGAEESSEVGGESTSGELTVSASAASTDTSTSTSSSSSSSSSSDESGRTSSTESSSSSTSSDSGPTPRCGDGVLDEGEACDDGNDEDADACTNACDEGFYTGSLEPCTEFGESVCAYFEAECRLAPDVGPLRSVCYWPGVEASCAATPGIWTAADSAFAHESGFDFPADGACITQLLNLACEDADQQACTDAGGTLCFQEMGPAGESLDTPSLCWWDIDELGCGETPGIWTTVDSGFGTNHPKSLAPSGAAACILQVTAL